MADEQRALQLENAEADARFWTGLHDANAESRDGFKGMAAKAEASATALAKLAASAAETAAEARDKAERLRRGEDVAAGLGKPLTRADVRRITGMTESQLRECELFSLACGDDDTAFDEYLEDLMKRQKKVDKAAKADRRWRGRGASSRLASALHWTPLTLCLQPNVERKVSNPLAQAGEGLVASARLLR